MNVKLCIKCKEQQIKHTKSEEVSGKIVHTFEKGSK